MNLYRYRYGWMAFIGPSWMTLCIEHERGHVIWRWMIGPRGHQVRLDFHGLRLRQP